MTMMMNGHPHLDLVDQDEKGIAMTRHLIDWNFHSFSRRVSAHASSSSTSDSSSDSDDIGPLTNGDLDSRPQRTARLAKNNALKRMRLDFFGTNWKRFDVGFF